MTMRSELSGIAAGLASLAVFRGVLRDPAVRAFRDMIGGGDLPVLERVDRCGEFSCLLLDRGGNWSRCLLDRLLCDENAYVRRFALGEPLPRILEAAVRRELVLLERAGGVAAEDVIRDIGADIEISGWETEPLDYAAAFRERLSRLGEYGYGIFAEYFAFLLEGGELTPVLYPDPVDYGALTGYERERRAVYDNTMALLDGRPAANALLYGDSGTGKSTCVKAVAGGLRNRGLRLIELRKDQLIHIPALIDRLCGNPLKFILFIDDLSFTRASDQFSALKAVLEGSVSARPRNMVIYATSNRRHLIRESFSAREGDDVHVRDTVEELSSLSDRFGLHVTFLRPDRELYLAIAESCCKELGVEFGAAAAERAEAFALSRGGRSARTASQFAQLLAAEVVRGWI